jgi:hypothetical protein
MKRIVLYLICMFSSGLFFTNIYNSVVNAANWESNVPHSIAATREFFTVANPGTFFKMVDPSNIILIVLALVLYWKEGTIRMLLGIGLCCFLISMVLTFTYFYPRNEIMFLTKDLPSIEMLQKAANEWGRMNWIRSAIWFIGLVCCMMALDNVLSNKNIIR